MLHLQGRLAGVAPFGKEGLSYEDLLLLWEDAVVDCVQYIREHLLTKFGNNLDACKSWLQMEYIRYASPVIDSAIARIANPFHHARFYGTVSGRMRSRDGVVSMPFSSIATSSPYATSSASPSSYSKTPTQSMFQQPPTTQQGFAALGLHTHSNMDIFTSSTQPVSQPRPPIPLPPAMLPFRLPFTAQSHPKPQMKAPNAHWLPQMPIPTPVSIVASSSATATSSMSVISSNDAFANDVPPILASYHKPLTNASTIESITFDVIVNFRYRACKRHEVEDIRKILVSTPFKVDSARAIQDAAISKRFYTACMVMKDKTGRDVTPCYFLATASSEEMLPRLFVPAPLTSPFDEFTASSDIFAQYEERPTSLILCRSVPEWTTSYYQPNDEARKYFIKHSQLVFPLYYINISWPKYPVTRSSTGSSSTGQVDVEEEDAHKGSQ